MGGCCVAKMLDCLVFHPPKPPTYNAEKLVIDDYVDTPHGTRLPLIVRATPDLLLPLPLKRLVFKEEELHLKYPGTTILYNHGNSEDLGDVVEFLRYLASICKVNVVAYDYSGYGVATGKPSEKHLYEDIEAVYDHLVNKYEIPPHNIILFGRSLGSGPAIDLASRKPVRGLILHSPLLSVVRTKCNCLVCCGTWHSDMFPNVDKLQKVHCPVFVIHGTKDQVVPFWHGQLIHDNLPNSITPLWISGAGHNTLNMTYEAFFKKIKRFLQRVDGMIAGMPTDAVMAASSSSLLMVGSASPPTQSDKFSAASATDSPMNLTPQSQTSAVAGEARHAREASLSDMD